MSFSVGNRLIAAIDAPTRLEASELVDRLAGQASWIKLGLELFCAEGPGVVTAFARRGDLSIMLDLKLHDIPETVGRATRRVADLGAGLLTVHAAGGRAMLEAAVAAAGATRILAVTVLTSLDAEDQAATGCGPVEEVVIARARLAIAAGCHGVVASPREVAAIRAFAPPAFLVVTPGIRPAAAAAGDQKRVMTPREARAAGADLIVVGRPLRDAPDPAAAAKAIASELS